MRILFSTLFVLASLGLSAQATQFQRIYDSQERSMFNISSSATPSNALYNLNFYIDTTGEVGLNVTRFFPKGDVEWSFDFVLDSLGAGENPVFTGLDQYADIVSTEDGGAMVSFLNFGLINPTVAIGTSKGYFKLDRAGELVYAYNIDTDDPLSLYFPGRTELEQNGFSGAYMMTHSARDTFIQEILLSNIDESGNLLWSKGIIPTDSTDQLRTVESVDLTSTSAEAGILLSSLVDFNLDTTYLLLHKTDELGDSEWSFSYRPDSLLSFGLDVNETASGADTTYVNVGTVIADFGAGPATVPYVLKVNRDGSVAWAKSIFTNDPNVFFFVPTNVDYLSNGNIVVMSRYLGFDGANGEFSIILNPDGEVVATQTYDMVRGVVFIFNQGQIQNRFFESGLSPSVDGGFVYTSTGFTENTFNHYIIKADDTGSAFCSTPMMLDSLFDFPFVADTMLLSERQVGITDSAFISRSPFAGYDVPVPNLLDTMFCPQDPINVTLDATQPGAVSYLWESGETTPTLMIDDVGSYRVTVTIDEDVCFTLCDTATIERLEFPGVSIIPDNTALCETGDITLNASASGPRPYTYVWSTTEDTPGIVVSAPGTYTVTVTDDCQNTAEGSFTLNPDDFVIPFVFTIINEGNLSCEDGVPSVTLSIVETVGMGETYTWSTGDVGPSIQVSQTGIYSVTGISNCGTVTVNEIEVEEFGTLFDISFDLAYRYICQDDAINIFTNPFNLDNVSNYKWSTGEGGPFESGITVTEPGLYELTITDDCGTESIAGIQINEENFQLEFGLGVNGLVCDPISGAEIFVSFETADIGSYAWSNGETGANIETIVVNEPGNYMLTLTDQCGNETVESIDVQAESIPAELVSSIAFDCLVDLDDVIELCGEVTGDGNLTSVMWTGPDNFISNENCILLNAGQIGDFVFSASNECESFDASFEVTSNTYLCGQKPCLEFPNIFFPNSQTGFSDGVRDSLTLNRTFGPYVKCDSTTITDFSIQIFNRWGKRVFEASADVFSELEFFNPNTGGGMENWEWDGTFNGTPLEGGVYMYNAAWVNFDGEDEVTKGHVTLVR